ncbi:MAG: Fpg/Nei family DNA glycosylase [Puniceicoccaceae bacterium]|nr:MAG: Fpg/Nei family DNA glycosylase [Puniceicoccaceae bacterium]
MPELAEVEFIRRRWDPGLGRPIERIRWHPRARVFRGADAADLSAALTGARLLDSAARGKQIRFRTDRGHLGIHLGMTGNLTAESPGYLPGRHDHLVLETGPAVLVFTDPRLFGRIRWSPGAADPPWWTSLPEPPHTPGFTFAHFQSLLHRFRRAPLKAVLLRQEAFAGVGNWMADEILWRAAIHPARRPADLSGAESRTLFRALRFVCRRALETIGRDFRDPPRTWLFPHRWEDGGRCPRTGAPLVRETIGGRTTCWSPGRQPPP